MQAKSCSFVSTWVNNFSCYSCLLDLSLLSTPVKEIFSKLTCVHGSWGWTGDALKLRVAIISRETVVVTCESINMRNHSRKSLNIFF